MSTPCYPLVSPYAIQAKPLTKMTQAPKDPEKVSRRTKPVLCIETGKIFASRAQAGDSVGCSGYSIGDAVRKGTSVSGFHWRDA